MSPIFLLNSGEQSYTLVDQAGCYSDRYGSYTTLDAAQEACSADKNCQGIYHQTCGTISFQSTLFLCPKDKTYSQSIGPTASCVYQKTGKSNSGVLRKNEFKWIVLIIPLVTKYLTSFLHNTPELNETTLGFLHWNEETIV